MGHGTRDRLIAAAVVMLLAGSACAENEALATSSCATSGPATGPTLSAYTVMVCIETPPAESTLQSDTVVNATASLSKQPPAIRHVEFSLDGTYLLTDGAAPYSFTLPVGAMPEGDHILQARAVTSGGFRSLPAVTTVNFAAPPAPSLTFTPRSVPDRPSPVTVAAVGDGASWTGPSTGVSNLIVRWRPDLFLYLGDVYERGTLTEFRNWYGMTERWGRLRAITNPTIGNHEALTPEASGYMAFWGDPPRAYAADAGTWRLATVDSNCMTSAGCGTDSPAYTFLEEQLAGRGADCTLVFFHHAVFSTGSHGTDAGLQALWRLMVDHDVDIVVTGHDHSYQRWAPLDAEGAPDPSGPRQFVVGTGGRNTTPVSGDPRIAHLEGPGPRARGALRLELADGQAAFRYITAKGIVADSGTIPCAEPQERARTSSSSDIRSDSD